MIDTQAQHNVQRPENGTTQFPWRRGTGVVFGLFLCLGTTAASAAGWDQVNRDGFDGRPAKIGATSTELLVFNRGSGTLAEHDEENNAWSTRLDTRGEQLVSLAIEIDRETLFSGDSPVVTLGGASIAGCSMAVGE